uniref:Phosphoserine phosphatase n=5 Tax=Passeriformes TaxID=9126 RepID=A0A8C3DU12_CORMO
MISAVHTLAGLLLLWMVILLILWCHLYFYHYFLYSIALSCAYFFILLPRDILLSMDKGGAVGGRDPPSLEGARPSLNPPCEDQPQLTISCSSTLPSLVSLMSPDPDTSLRAAPGGKKATKRMASLMELKEIFRSADAVCFDVDSTVIREEGIDELAKFCGVGDAVAEMTRRAMGGTVTFKAALTARLGLIRPSYEQVQKLISDNPPQLTPGIRELVSRLHQRGVQVFLVSGGFQSIVEHVALQLNIPTANVFANRLKFYFNGEYAGFDETQPTAESGGKGKVISHLKEQFHFKKVVMIGDGATDMEACPPGDCFIGFGGNVVRKQVKEKAKWYITHFDELLKELEER